MGLGSPGSTRRRASIWSARACRCGSSTTSPRAMSSLPMPSPARLSPQRSPARPSVEGVSWARMERMRAARPEGLSTTRSPTCTAPDSTVPVTTVPVPDRLKERFHRQPKRPTSGRWVGSGRLLKSLPDVRHPRAVAVDTGRTGAPARLVPSSAASISALTEATRAASTRSVLVSAPAHG